MEETFKSSWKDVAKWAFIALASFAVGMGCYAVNHGVEASTTSGVSVFVSTASGAGLLLSMGSSLFWGSYAAIGFMVKLAEKIEQKRNP